MAREFFEQLRAASIEVLKLFGLPIDQGHKRYRKWKRARPIGNTVHFTAGVTWKGSIRWLNDGGHKNQVSCQFMILDRMLPEVAAIYAKYPLLKDLRVVVLMLSDGIIPVWHGGWVNRLNTGVENRNAGILKGKEGDWRWWPKGWTAKFPHEKLGKTPIAIDGQWWEPYPADQILANIQLGQMLHCYCQDYGGLDPRWWIGHSCSSDKKWDPGKAFPSKHVRDAVFAQMPTEGIPWLKDYQAQPEGFVMEMENEDDEFFLMELEERKAERRSGDLDWDAVEEMPTPEFQALIQDGNWKQELDSVRRALEKLTYVTGGQGPVLDEDTANAVFQFQMSKGPRLEGGADKIPGSSTQEALYARLKQFKLVA